MKDQEKISETPYYDALEDKYKRLVDTYFSNGMNQCKAYFDVLYRGKLDRHFEQSIRVSASKTFALPKIRSAVNERLDALRMPVAESVYRLSEQAKNVAARYLREDGSYDLAGLIDDGYAHLIKGTKYDREGRLVVEFFDAQAALVRVAQIGGAFGPKGTKEDPHQHEHSHHITNLDNLLAKYDDAKQPEP